MREIKRILVRRVAGLGDLILTLPLLEALRKRFPEADLELLAHREHIDLLLVTGHIDAGYEESLSEWHILFSGKRGCSGRLRPDPSSYDLLILFVREGSPLVKVLYDIKGPLVCAIPPIPHEKAKEHVISTWVRRLPFLKDSPFLLPSITLPSDLLTEGEKRLKVIKRKLGCQRVVAIHPGSGSPLKNWPVERFSLLIHELADEGDIGFLILEGPSDRYQIEGLAPMLKGLAFFVAKPMGLLELASLLSYVDLYVGNDSGVTHLTAALGVKVIAIFGPSDPRVWAPLHPRAITVYRKEKKCTPCHPSGRRSCSYEVCRLFPTLKGVLPLAIRALKSSPHYTSSQRPLPPRGG